MTEAGDFVGEEGLSGLPQPSEEGHVKVTLTHPSSQDFDPHPRPTAEDFPWCPPLHQTSASSTLFSPFLEPHITHLSYSQGPATSLPPSS